MYLIFYNIAVVQTASCFPRTFSLHKKFIRVIHVNLSCYIIHAHWTSLLFNEIFQWAMGPWHVLFYHHFRSSSKSIISEYLEDACKNRLHGSDESRLHAHSRRESHLQTEMTNDTIVIACLFYRVRIISKTYFFISRVCKTSDSYTWERGINYWGIKIEESMKLRVWIFIDYLPYERVIEQNLMKSSMKIAILEI